MPNDITSYRTPLLSKNKRNRIISQGEKRYLEFNDVINDGAKQKMYFLRLYSNLESDFLSFPIWLIVS